MQTLGAAGTRVPAPAAWASACDRSGAPYGNATPATWTVADWRWEQM